MNDPKNRKSVSIPGPVLRSLRNEKLISQDELAASARMSRATIQRIERSADTLIHAGSFKRIAAALQISVDELLRRCASPLAKSKTDAALLPTGIGRIYPANMVPLYDTGLDASRRVELTDPKPIKLVPLPVEGRAFLTRLSGDCMAPDFADGELVCFSYDAVDREGVIDGKPYYIQLSDGSATFKLIYRDSEDLDCWKLEAINKRKYPKPIRVHRDEVVRVAKAVGKYAPLVIETKDGER